MKPQNILFVSHCLFNVASKVARRDIAKRTFENDARIAFLHKALDAGVQLIQLPCPEFTIYGPDRWGHSRDQFDNSFFRAHCRQILAPFVQQMAAYLHPSQRDKFRVLGVVGIEGSPSCGVNYTCAGAWGGEFSGNEDLPATLASIHRVDGPGVMIEELVDMLKSSGMTLPMVAFNAQNMQPLYALLEANA